MHVGREIEGFTEGILNVFFKRISILDLAAVGP
jgi:hypothetical protein